MGSYGDNFLNDYVEVNVIFEKATSVISSVIDETSSYGIKKSIVSNGNTTTFRFDLNELKKWNGHTTITALSQGYIVFQEHSNKWPRININVKYISKDGFESDRERVTKNFS